MGTKMVDQEIVLIFNHSESPEHSVHVKHEFDSTMLDGRWWQFEITQSSVPHHLVTSRSDS
jgi:hypothetical protein